MENNAVYGAEDRQVDLIEKTYGVAARLVPGSSTDSLAASGLFVTKLKSAALDTKDRQAVAPLSMGYISDVDDLVSNRNPRSSVDSGEFLKLFEHMPNLDQLAYAAARRVRPEVERAFPAVTKEKDEVLRAITYGLSFTDQGPSLLGEFAKSSRFMRTPEVNTLEYNVSILNKHVDDFRKQDYRILSHDYSSPHGFGYRPWVKVFSTANGALNLDDHVCTRRTRLNGESHFIVKYGENGALPGSRKTEFAYVKLTNRLSVFLDESGSEVENVSVAYNLDPRSIRSLYLRDVDVVFHDYGEYSLELLVSSKKMAAFFEKMNYTGQYAHIYLDELLKEEALLGVWLLKNSGAGCVTDLLSGASYQTLDADADNAKSMWHIANLDSSKRHYCKIGSKASVTAYSGKALIAEISKVGQVKYGTMIKSIFENERSGRFEAWLESPRLYELYSTHDDALFDQMLKDLGKIHTVNVTIDGKKIPAIATSFDLLDVEREKEVALFLSTYFLMMEHRAKLQKMAASPKTQAMVDSAKKDLASAEAGSFDSAKAALKVLSYSTLPVSMMQFGFESLFYKDGLATVYSSTETSYREYLNNYLSANEWQKSRIELTPISDGSTHVLIKGCSYNNNYNEEFTVTKAGEVVRRVSSYAFPGTSYARSLTDPTKMILKNGFSSDKTVTISDVRDLFDLVGKDVQTHSRFFY